jgi:hypothetical protein
MDIHREIRRKFKLNNKAMRFIPSCSSVRFNRNHLAQLFGEVGFNRGAEIGVRRGRFSEIMCKCNPNLFLYCIDPWSPIENKYNAERQKQIYEFAAEKLAKYNTKIIKKTSMDALADIENNELDFVFIDGNHDFDYVMMDIILWADKVKSGGIIAVHDFYNGEVGVVKAVEAYTHSHSIRPWFVTKEHTPTAYWVNP